ncbi:hypothetical protein F7731_01860 [Cytobacillus depressus]|uniref:Uncharacterized protein n=1 Tax=Cytobacillus depressus TaxID=1602942 RepID=A0A6L3VGF9_9BACI|nr:hypothetical protein [Cytobacillus depressus]KAB2338335.1 hypothetical protein F7731_01860 [Cytobacillus depressus]
MEGLTFYWFSWMFWVITTFFMKMNSKLRLFLSIWVLILIILSPYSFSSFGFEISYVSIILLGTLFYMISKIKRLTAAYVLISSFITMMAYVCFQLYALFDPVWIIVSRNWMLALLLVSLTLILQANKYYRVIIILLGSIQGEFLYAHILKKYSFPYLIGSVAYLDVAALSSALLCVWTGFELLASFYERYFNQVEKEKQKLS